MKTIDSRYKSVVLLVSIMTLLTFVIGCSNIKANKTYLSEKMGYSFSYPYDFVITPNQPFFAGEINHEEVIVQEDFGKLLYINVIDLKDKNDIFLEALPDKYHDRVKNLLEEDNFIICSFDLGMIGYFKPYLIYIWWTVRPKNIVPGKQTITQDTELEEQMITKKVVLNIMKSFKFTNRYPQEIIIIENNDHMRNMMLLMLKAIDFFKRQMNLDEMRHMLEKWLLHIKQQYKIYNKEA